METNIGNIDRIIRLMLGTFILVLGVYYQNWWGTVGLIPLITGTIEYCPIYSLLGISSYHGFHRVKER
ncbi:YgaP family membrane protein [Fodinibius salsisoli]|uniref:DUF2892 domain-containing protein n=1 Tax=Fodinibius salsisoli TaxID=2820877 RepID=A0ABT3PIU8_9BACT|nr:DUF2892 domain-containing protein [Fodinibius salsisoli]